MTHCNIHCSSSTLKMDSTLEFNKTIQVIHVNRKHKTVWCMAFYYLYFMTREISFNHRHRSYYLVHQFVVDISPKWNLRGCCTLTWITEIYVQIATFHLRGGNNNNVNSNTLAKSVSYQQYLMEISDIYMRKLKIRWHMEAITVSHMLITFSRSPIWKEVFPSLTRLSQRNFWIRILTRMSMLQETGDTLRTDAALTWTHREWKTMQLLKSFHDSSFVKNRRSLMVIPCIDEGVQWTDEWQHCWKAWRSQ